TDGTVVCAGKVPSGSAAGAVGQHTITAIGQTSHRKGTFGFTLVPQVANFTGTGISGPNGIAAGPDGALWFTNQDNNSSGLITTPGIVAKFSGPGIFGPEGIASGPDGALWFTSGGNGSSIGRITTAGIVTNFTGPGISSPLGIASGSDGALWFTNA